MSITVETLATKRVIDTRTDVNSYARRTYEIFDGPQDAGYVRFQPNGGNGTANNQLNFTLNPPSTRVFVNRRIVIEATFDVKIVGKILPGTRMLNFAGCGATLLNVPGVTAAGTTVGSSGGTSGPRAYPLANATRSLQVALNNDQLSQNLGQYWRATTRYANGLAQSETDLGTTATMLDLTTSYSESFKNPLSPFESRGLNPIQTSRSSLYGIQIISNPEGGEPVGNIFPDTTAVIRFTVREPLFLSPFLFQRGQQDTGLIGIQTMNLQLQLGGRGGSDLASAVYSIDSANMFPPIAGPGGPQTGAVSITAETIESYVYVNFLTPDALQIIPEINNYPYYEPTLYTTVDSQALVAGQTREIVMNNVQLNSIPQRLLIFVDEPDSRASVFKSDTYCSIEKINISFDNRDSLLAAATTVDLYNIAAKNNTNLTWTEWNRDVGSVLCLNFGEDIPLRANQAVGLRGSYNLRMTVTVRNVNTQTFADNISEPVGVNMPLGVALNVVVFGVGVLTIAQQNVVRTIGILTNEDVLRSKMQPAVPYMNSGDLYGGGWFDDFRNAFMSVAKPLAGIAAKVLPMLAPETAPFVGAFNSIINPEPSAGPGNTGLVRSYGNGLTGGRLVGGKKVTRAQLAKMMR